MRLQIKYIIGAQNCLRITGEIPKCLHMDTLVLRKHNVFFGTLRDMDTQLFEEYLEVDIKNKLSRVLR